VRAERPLALPAERALQQGAEDGRLDPLPVEVARGPQQLELVGLEVDSAGVANSPPLAYGVPA
jgi:hypothetical protein